jgi:hypothetical protein
MGKAVTLAIATVCAVLIPVAARAQASIAGSVRDTSGAVLPGVTVEASSPALIEKTRAVVSDGAGQYQIANLVPGTYAVTFTLAGFNAVRREGVELTGSFTANINADLRVGALEETITVTGETPVVDVQNTTQERRRRRWRFTAAVRTIRFRCRTGCRSVPDRKPGGATR